MNNNSNQSIFFLVSGLFLIISVVFLNEWTIAQWLSYGGTLRVFDRVFIWIINIACVGGGFFLIGKRHDLHVGKAEFLLLSGTLGLLLVGSEIAARVLDAAHGYDFLQNKQRAERGIIPFRMFGPDFYTKKGTVRTIVGRHGAEYPFVKDDGAYRIVAMGGSTTQDIVDGVDYPSRLEQLLSKQYPNHTIEVINVGNSGYATPHLLNLLMLDVLSWEPDLIIASENVNDLLAAYFPNFALDYSNKYANQVFLPEKSFMQQVFGWSRLYWVLRSRMEALSYRLLEINETVYTRRPYGVEPPAEAAMVFRRNWETFINITRNRDIPVILASQPLEQEEAYWDLHMRYKKYNNVAVYPLHEEFVLHHAAYNAILKEVAYQKNVFFVDNANMFNGTQSLFVDFVHYTSEGIDTLARNYAEFIVRRKLIP